MKFWKHKYDWTDNDMWALPDSEHMMQAQLESCLDDQIEAVTDAVARAGKYIPPRTAIQAGGAFGHYPLALSRYFEKTWTFEPLPENLECLTHNFKKCPQLAQEIVIAPYPLWDIAGVQLWMEYSKRVKNSYGAHHVSHKKNDSEAVFSVTIDSYQFDDVDLIWLDIEGAEKYAIRGAAETIKRCRPVIVLEQRNLPQMRLMGTTSSQAGTELQRTHGYKYVGKTAGDSIFLPE